MAPNIAQSGTAGRDVWYTGTMQGCPSSTGSFSFRVPVTGGCYDVEADHGHDCRAGSVRAAARRAGTCGHAGQRNDAHGPGDRPELSHHQRRDGPVSQRLRASVRQGRRATWHPGERRDDLSAGQLEAGRSPDREARATRREQGDGDRHPPVRERVAHHRDQDGRGRELMRHALAGGAGLCAAALLACGSPAPSAPPSNSLTLLFLRRSPAASLGGLSWAPDPEHSRLVAFDGRLRVARSVTSPRLANPVAVASLGAELLVSERTGEGVVLDTTGRPVREWESPHLASIYAARGSEVVAVRSPYYIPQFAAEPDTASLIRVLDTLGRPVAGLDTASGAILATRHLGARETAVAVDPRGRLVTFDADSLLGQSAGPERETFTPAFALPDLHGDTVALARFAGKVTLVNFWASWCDPCRQEFPHMAQLYSELDRKDFEIVAISDDVDRGKMAAFLRAYRPPFPILVGGGRMKQAYHYRGLPYSVLLDRRGRIIERIFGFGGAAEFSNLRRTIANEVRAP